MKKFSKRTLLKIFCFFIALFLIVFLPTITFSNNVDFDYIYSTFVGEKCSYQGIIEIWNIDTFESGLKSKTKFFKEISQDFQKKYRGIYIMVRDVSEIECENLLASGQKPDLFSCSYGVAEKIKPYLQSFKETDFELYENFLNAGKVEDELYGVAWCAGLYFLISTNNYLEKAGKEASIILEENALNLGYQKQGKKIKDIYSLSLSQKNYLMPLSAIQTYNEKGESLISKLSFNTSQEFSQYEAYVNFLLGNSVVLLGSQRDVVRITKRENIGKIQDIIIEPLTKFSDLVQFMFVAKTDNTDKFLYMQKFVKFLLSIQNQSKVVDMNMFPVINFEYTYELKGFNQISCNILKELIINNAFLSITEIKKLQHNN